MQVLTVINFVAFLCAAVISIRYIKRGAFLNGLVVAGAYLASYGAIVYGLGTFGIITSEQIPFLMRWFLASVAFFIIAVTSCIVAIRRS